MDNFQAITKLHDRTHLYMALKYYKSRNEYLFNFLLEQEYFQQDYLKFDEVIYVFLVYLIDKHSFLISNFYFYCFKVKNSKIIINLKMCLFLMFLKFLIFKMPES